MTQLNLICYEPYYIGLLGTISFVSFAIGSFFFTKQADVYGRHKIVCIAATVTPICLSALIIGSRKLGIFFLYAVFGIMGLTYNPRGSTVYLYAVELLPVDTRLLFGSALFFTDGCISIFASVYFYYWKN
jgi:MFS family permease